MDTISTVVLIILVVGGIAWKKAAKAAKEASPETKATAKQIGGSLLKRLLK